MATRYAVAFGIANGTTSRENQKEVENINDNIIFLKNSFLNHFKNLKDPRIDRSKEHLLIDIIAISILAVISGADGWTAIETYGKAKKQWLRTFLELPNGIPSHDTISRVKRAIKSRGIYYKFFELDEFNC